jgi:hypothetical protein
MPDHDVIGEVLVAADPLRDVTLPLPASPEALAVRDRAKGVPAPSRRSKRRLVVGAAVVGVLGATGATVAYGGGDGRAASSDGLVCVGSASHDLVMRFDPRTDDPLTSCAGEWEEAFGVPAPAVLSACVDSSEQGSIEVRPGPVEVCAEHGDVPYTGPTDEQLRYAAFLEEAEALGARAEADGITCPTYDDVRAVLDALLAKHGLTGWTYGTTGTDPEPPGDCARVEGFVEYKKLIVVTVFDEP